MSLGENDTKIAGEKTVQDWIELKKKLDRGSWSEEWDKAFDGFLMERLNTRYFAPISAIKKSRNFSGEGFSIVTIQCALIEFLAALEAGVNYRYGAAKSLTEYGGSQELFVDFIRKNAPFKNCLTKAGAKSFYSNVRCGLLHEAQTKGGWKILADKSHSPAIDAVKMIVYRDVLTAEISEYLCGYKEKLKSEPDKRVGFIRKFDNLANT